MSSGTMSELEDTILQEVLEPMCVSYLDRHPDANAINTRERFLALLEVIQTGLQRASAGPMILYAKRHAREQFASGNSLDELLELFSLLELAVWRKTLETTDPGSALARIGRLSTIFGMGRDTLVREYVSLLISHRSGPWAEPGVSYDAPTRSVIRIKRETVTPCLNDGAPRHLV